MKIHFESNTHPPVDVPDGAPLSEHLTVQNSPILFGCRTGVCGTCQCEVTTGYKPPESDSENELLSILNEPDASHRRLACQLQATHVMTLRYVGEA